MNDYKELLGHPELCWGYVDELRMAIEQLVKERDAAIVYIPSTCFNCKHFDGLKPTCKECKWEWRGVSE